MAEKNKKTFFKGFLKKSLKNQVENYATLGSYRSARGIASFLLISSAVATIAAMIFGYIPLVNLINLIVVSLILILAFFVYQGKKWAMIVAMIFWTFCKITQIFIGYPVFIREEFSLISCRILSIIGWVIFMLVIGYSYWVERKKSLKSKL